MDFRKNYCIYHPSETITNFCRQKQCLLPLCPSCISIHLKFHNSHGQHTQAPVFDNISDSIGFARALMSQSAEKLQNQRLRLSNIDPNKASSQLREVLFSAKIRIKELIDQKFADVEKESLALIEKQNKELGLHSQEKIGQLYDRISKEVEQLRQAQYQIKGDKCLSVLITFLNQGITAIEKLNYEALREIEFNEAYKKEVTVNEGVFNDISNILGKAINITFSLPNTTQKVNVHQPRQSINISSLSLSKNLPVTMNRFMRAESPRSKIEQPPRSFTPTSFQTTSQKCFGRALQSSVIGSNLIPCGLTSHKSQLFKTSILHQEESNPNLQMGDSMKGKGRRSTGKLGLTIIPEKRGTQQKIDEFDRIESRENQRTNQI